MGAGPDDPGAVASIARQRKPHFPALMLVLACVPTLFAVIGGEMVIRGILLKYDSEEIEAEVTRAAETRRGRRSGNSPYILEYRFRPPNADDWYSHTDPLTHGPSHVGVSAPVWQAARDSGRIRVQYVPRFPSVNRPLDHTPLEGLACPATMATFVTLLAFTTWASFFDEFRKYLHAPKHPPPEPPHNPPMQQTEPAGAGAVKPKSRRRRGGR